MTSEQLTAIISQIVDDNGEAVEAMDFTRADHRNYLAGTIAHAMLDRADVRVISPPAPFTPNTSEDK